MFLWCVVLMEITLKIFSSVEEPKCAYCKKSDVNATVDIILHEQRSSRQYTIKYFPIEKIIDYVEQN